MDYVIDLEAPQEEWDALYADLERRAAEEAHKPRRRRPARPAEVSPEAAVLWLGPFA